MVPNLSRIPEANQSNQEMSGNIASRMASGVPDVSMHHSNSKISETLQDIPAEKEQLEDLTPEEN